MHTPTALVSALVCQLALAATLLAQEPQEPVLPDDPFLAIAKMPVQEPVADGLRARVVGDGGTPLAGVSVVVIANPRAIDRNRIRKLLAQARAKYGGPGGTEFQCAIFALFGKRFVTGSDGNALLPKLTQDGQVLAVRGRDIAVARAGNAKQVIELALISDEPIHVLVVGPNGRPARGVPVGIVPRLDFVQVGRAPETTDRKGRAQVRLGRLRQRPPKTVFVRALAVTRKPVAFELDPRKFANDADHPIKLTLPEFGRVHVQLLGANRKSLPIDGAFARIVDPGVRFRGFGREYLADAVAKGTATFTAVEVGLPLEIGCVYDGRRRPQTVQTSGPERHMGSKLVTITGVTAPTRLSGRVLGLDGKPVASETLGVIFMTGKSKDGSEITTDAEGRFEVVAPDGFVDAESGRVLLVRRFAAGARPAKYLGAREFSLPVVKRKALGDVKLVEEELIVSGSVVDDDGKPIAGALVSIPKVYGQFNSYGYGGAREFFETEAETDAKGRFALRALGAADGPFELSAMHAGYRLRDGKTVAKGASDHQIVMGRTQSIHGRLLGFRGSVNQRGLRITARAQDGTELRLSTIGAQGAFEIQGCLAGDYTVTFARRMARDDPFLTVENVHVEPGTPCRDPRLANIDLSQHVRVVKVTVLGPDKKPVEATVWQYRVRPGGSHGFGTGTRNGVAYLFLPKAGGKVSVQPQPTCLPQRFPMLKGDVVVQLEPALRVRLQLNKLPKLPDGTALSAIVFPVVRTPPAAGNNWGRHTVRNRVPVAAGGKVEFYTSGPGDHRLLLSPARRRGGVLGRGRPLELRFAVEKPAADGKDAKVTIELSESQQANLEALLGQATQASGRR